MLDTVDCPFVYANVKKCCGVSCRARAYCAGRHHPERDRARKYRLWCSEKDDQAGAVATTDGKPRMEFYPRKLGQGIEDRLWSSGLLS
jgi:hypothetical protein